MDRQLLERHQVLVYLAAIAVGLPLGALVPALAPVAELLLWPALVLLLYATFVQVPLLHLRDAARDTRFTGAVLVGNFLVLPLVVWGLVQVLPPDPTLRLGVLLVLLVPCTDWFITFTQLAGGDTPRAIAVTPLVLALQLLLLPAYLLLMARTEVTGVVRPAGAVAALLVVLVPLGLAILGELRARAGPGRVRVGDRLAWAPVPLLGLVILLIAVAQVDAVAGALMVLPVVVPVYAAFLTLAVVVALVLGRVFVLPAAQRRTLTFSLGTRNSFLVLPFALALPAGMELAAVVIVVQSLVELLGMVVLLWGVPRLHPAPRG